MLEEGRCHQASLAWWARLANGRERDNADLKRRRPELQAPDAWSARSVDT